MSKRSPAAARRAPRPQLAATLIVKNEEGRIKDCLEALRPVVDEIHVHDTGSTDATPHLATLLGAQLSRGPWTDDFARARNDALQGWSAQWALAVDADERVVADPEALRRFLGSTKADIVNVVIENRTDDGTTLHHVASRLFRPATVQWYGRLHEKLVAKEGRVRRVDVPAEILHLVHLGYSSGEVLKQKSVRNTEVARAAVGELAQLGDDVPPELAAMAMLDLGRSLYGAQRLQEAVEAFEAVREHFPNTPEWARATDMLTRLMINADMVDVALTLILQLRGAEASPKYCDWLEAHCLAKLGHLDVAKELLAGVTEIVDVAGSRHDVAELHHLRAQIDAMIEARRAGAHVG